MDLPLDERTQELIVEELCTFLEKAGKKEEQKIKFSLELTTRLADLGRVCKEMIAYTIAHYLGYKQMLGEGRDKQVLSDASKFLKDRGIELPIYMDGLYKQDEKGKWTIPTEGGTLVLKYIS